MAPRKKTAVKKESAPILVAPPPYVPKTPITRAQLKELYQEVTDYWIEECDRYIIAGEEDDSKPEHVTRRMQAILGAVDLETAQAAVKRAKQVIQTFLLAGWARGKFTGPTTERSLEKQIKNAESLALMLEKKGQDENAARQFARAEKLREQLRSIALENGG